MLQYIPDNELLHFIVMNHFVNAYDIITVSTKHRLPVKFGTLFSKSGLFFYLQKN